MRRRVEEFCRCFLDCQHGLHAAVAWVRLFRTGESDSYLGQMAQSMALDSERGSILLTTLIVDRIRILRQRCYGSQ